MKRFPLFFGLCLLLGAAHSQTTSNSVTFTVNNPVPTVASLSPASAVVGSAAQAVTAAGTNFLTNSTATFNGSSRPFTFVSPTSGKVALTAADLAATGTFPICVTNPTPGGGGPACANFQVASSLAIASLAPSSCVIYTTCNGLTLTVNGTGFVSGSTVNWNGTALTTTFVSASQVTATVPASSITIGATVSITVTNPAGSAGTVVGVTWLPPDTSPVPVAGYNVYRDGSSIGSVAADTTKFDNVVGSGTHAYFATAFGADGSESDPSNTATVVIP